MSHEAVANTIRTRFGTLVEDAEGVVTQYDNEPETDNEFDNLDLWCRSAILFGQGIQADAGASQNRHRFVGVLSVSVFAAIRKGNQAALALADVVSDSFRSVTVDGVVFRTPTPITVGKQGDKWWQLNINCPFYFDKIA